MADVFERDLCKDRTALLNKGCVFDIEHHKRGVGRVPPAWNPLPFWPLSDE